MDRRLNGIAVNITPVARLGFGLVRDQYDLDRSEELDLFTTLYEPNPQLVDPVEGHMAWYRAVQEVLGSALYENLHRTTILDEELSGVAVRPIMEELEPLVERYRDLEEQKREAELDQDEIRLEQIEKQERLLNAQAVQTVASAIQKAEDSVETVVVLRSMGCGDGAGRYVSLSYPDLPRISDLVRRTHHLFGRFRELFASVRANLPRRAVMVRGVTIGDELNRVIGSELSLLSDPETESLFDLKWVEKRLLIRDISRPPDRRRGDVVVLIDESGSMLGEAVLIAKSYAFALRSQLKQENRRCHIISFSYYPNEMVEVPEDATADQVIQWLGRAIGGGTEFTHPIKRAMEFNRDILMITDGEADVGAEFAKHFMEWKRRTGNRFFLVHVGRSPTLHPLADEVLLSDDAQSLWRHLQ